MKKSRRKGHEIWVSSFNKIRDEVLEFEFIYKSNSTCPPKLHSFTRKIFNETSFSVDIATQKKTLHRVKQFSRKCAIT